ncbi:MAG: hypothetical protein ACE5GX_05240 [Thermoanaerobaculia bacterium]
MNRYPSTCCLAIALALLAVDPATAQRRGGCGGKEATGWQASMVPDGEPGEPMEVSGRVFGTDGEPLQGVNIYAYQTDDEGYYSPRGSDENNARLCAVVQTNERGEYALATIRPGSYPTGGVPAHIHFELWRPGDSRQRHDLQFADDERVSERRKANLTSTSTVRTVERDDNGIWHVVRDFRLR